MGRTTAQVATSPGPAQWTDSKHVTPGRGQGLVSDREPQRREREATGATDPLPGMLSTAAQSWPPGRVWQVEVRVECAGRALRVSSDPCGQGARARVRSGAAELRTPQDTPRMQPSKAAAGEEKAPGPIPSQRQSSVDTWRGSTPQGQGVGAQAPPRL